MAFFEGIHFSTLKFLNVCKCLYYENNSPLQLARPYLQVLQQGWDLIGPAAGVEYLFNRKIFCSLKWPWRLHILGPHIVTWSCAACVGLAIDFIMR